jgi:hypothetical protein
MKEKEEEKKQLIVFDCQIPTLTPPLTYCSSNVILKHRHSVPFGRKKRKGNGKDDHENVRSRKPKHSQQLSSRHFPPEHKPP